MAPRTVNRASISTDPADKSRSSGYDVLVRVHFIRWIAIYLLDSQLTAMISPSRLMNLSTIQKYIN